MAVILMMIFNSPFGKFLNLCVAEVFSFIKQD